MIVQADVHSDASRARICTFRTVGATIPAGDEGSVACNDALPVIGPLPVTIGAVNSALEITFDVPFDTPAKPNAVTADVLRGPLVDWLVGLSC